MKSNYLIGDFCFTIEYPEDFLIPDNFKLFESDQMDSEYDYKITIANELPFFEGKVLAQRQDILILQTNTGEARYLSIKNMDGYYASYQEISDTKAEVVLLRDMVSDCQFDPFFNSLLALEKRLLTKSGLILHSAYMTLKGEAILFSAPSETGKSTQANLWGKYRGSRTVNGDRSLLQKVDKTWIARGWPVCGSSEICHNEDFPIRCIVMLSQGKTDEVRKLSSVEAFRLIYSQITVNGWNQQSVLHVMDLLDDLISSVPIYHLSCTISENAVSCLENMIYSEGE